MPQVCTICLHPERATIDTWLIAGEPLRNIAERTGTSATALHRHKTDHLPATLVKAAEAEGVAQALDVIAQLRAINGSSLAVLREARESRNGDLALKAVDRIQKQIELQAKLLGDLDERQTVNILVAPEWLATRAAIMAALAPHPLACVAVAERLSALETGS
jgi:hypothetical protein